MLTGAFRSGKGRAVLGGLPHPLAVGLGRDAGMQGCWHRREGGERGAGRAAVLGTHGGRLGLPPKHARLFQDAHSGQAALPEKVSMK